MPVEREIQPPVTQLEPPAVIEDKSPEFLADNQIAVPETDDTEAVVEKIEETHVPVKLSEGNADNEWHVLLPKLKLGGMAKQLAEHCLLKQLTDDKLILLLETSGVTLKTRLTEEAVQEALSEHFGRSLTVEYDAVVTIAETPAQRRVRYGKELQKKAEQAIEDDSFVQQLRRDYGGMILPGSVRPNKTNE